MSHKCGVETRGGALRETVEQLKSQVTLEGRLVLVNSVLTNMILYMLF